MYDERRTHSQLLRTSLRANAGFSILSGGVMIAESAPLGDWMGVPGSVVFWVGIVVFVNAFSMIGQSMKLDIPRILALTTIAGDIIWVAASGVLAAFRPGGMTGSGVAAILVVAGIVAAFAVAQSIGYQRYALSASVG